MSRPSRKKEKNQIKYTQYHLANERTYLAEYTPPFQSSASDSWRPASIFGLVMTFLAAQEYKEKRRQLLNETFAPSNVRITLISTMLVIIVTMVIIYFFLIM